MACRDVRLPPSPLLSPTDARLRSGSVFYSLREQHENASNAQRRREAAASLRARAELESGFAAARAQAKERQAREEAGSATPRQKVIATPGGMTPRRGRRAGL